jgi:transposase
MRGPVERQMAMLLGVTPEDFVPPDHPIRRIKALADRALQALSPAFDALYAADGRDSVPPEHLLKGSLLMALYSVPSERRFCERLHYDLLFKWFLDLNITDPAFHHSTFSKNRDRLLEHDVARQFFRTVRQAADAADLLSADHFSVDSTLLEAWASLKSFRPKADSTDQGPAASGDGPTPPGGEVPTPPGGEVPTPAEAPAPAPRPEKDPLVDFHGERRSNATHASTTDPEALLAKRGKGKEAKLSFAFHVRMENRNGLIDDLALTPATGRAEVETALELLERVPGGHRLTVGGDKGYDDREFVEQCRAMAVTPHVAQKTKGSAIDGRTSRHPGYAVSQRIRKRIEEIFGWCKTVGASRKLRYVGLAKNRHWVFLLATAYNLVRMSRLLTPATA